MVRIGQGLEASRALRLKINYQSNFEKRKNKGRTSL